MTSTVESVKLRYALITPAWNEEARLEETIKSVALQTTLPVRWIIVSDGSTDRTDQIAQSYAKEYEWIRVLRLERSSVRHFAGKAHAVNAGFASLKDIDFDLVGNLDADITLPLDYYEFLLLKFHEMPDLGVAGTPFIEDGGTADTHSYRHACANLQHVSGACQLFRRLCFEEIGGYTPIKGGGIDWVAVTTARMHGWTTRTFIERTSTHHRAMGTADRNRIRARFRHGQEDYYVGNHPLWEIPRSLFQMKNRPLFFGGLALMAGYIWAWLSRRANPIPQDLRTFHRSEQMARMRKMIGLRRGTDQSASGRMTKQSNLNPAIDMSVRSGPPASLLMMAYTHYETDPRVMRAAEAARDEHFLVDVIALRRYGQPDTETVRGVRVFRIQGRYRGASRLQYILNYIGFFLRCTFACTRLFLSRRYNVIHVHNMPDALVFAALIPKLFGAKIILDIHDPMPETYASKFSSLTQSIIVKLILVQEKLSVACADATITVSEPLKNGILLKHGYHPESIGVVANFADTDIFRPMTYPRIEGTVRFVFHGTILERYGLRILVEAILRVRNREKLQVRIIGEGDFSRTLSNLIEEYCLGDVVEFVNHFYPLHDIPKVLSDCHVGLVPLDVGTSSVANFALPLKLVEYTCLGMPTITVRNAAIEHYFHLDECMFFKSGDVMALATLIDSVAENPRILNTYRRKLKTARARLSWNGEKEKYITLLRKCSVRSFESNSGFLFWRRREQ